MPEIQAPVPAAQVSPRQRKWAERAFWIMGTIAVVYAMIYADVVLRAREAYLEGEKYMRWHEHPDQKRAEIAADFDRKKTDLDKKLGAAKLKKDEFDRQLEILEFDRRRALEESAVKYAYVWYQTAYELFSPPESKWVKLSRQKAPTAKERWKEELRAQKIPFEDYMLE